MPPLKALFQTEDGKAGTSSTGSTSFSGTTIGDIKLVTDGQIGYTITGSFRVHGGTTAPSTGDKEYFFLLDEVGTPPAAMEPLNADEMRVHFINVGQGDATLLEFPCGVALIDTGGEDSPEYDSVPVLKSYLDGFFARQTDSDETFDLLVLTHPHIDHTRGVDMILENYYFTHVVDNGQMRNDIGGRPQLELQQWIEYQSDFIDYRSITKADITSSQGLTGPIIDPIGSCSASDIDPRITVLWGQLEPNESGANNINNHSVVFRVDFGDFSLLLTGDLQEEAIDGLLAKYKTNQSILDVDVCQVGHHGSHNATTKALVEAMSPKLAVFSMGPWERQNGRFIAYQFGHPNHKAVEAIEEGVTCTRDAVTQHLGIKGAWGGNPSVWEERSINAALFATGWDGTVVLKAKADGDITLSTEKDGTEQGLSCPPD